MKNKKGKNRYATMVKRGMWLARSRILAIFGIVALGVGFLFGMVSTAPDMYITVDKYLDDTDMMDLRILSNYGFTDKDIEAISSSDGVLRVNGAYNADVIMQDSENTYVTLVHSLPRTDSPINSTVLVDGRMPENPGECVVDIGNFEEGQSMDIGTVLTFTDEKDAAKSIKEKEYTVVGTVNSSRYCSVERESSKKGNGVVGLIIYIPEEDFNFEIFTSAYLIFDSTKSLNAFKDEYIDKVSSLTDTLKANTEQRRTDRFNAIKADAQKEIDKGKEELAEAQKLFDDTKKQKDELFDGINKCKEGILALEQMGQTSIPQYAELKAQLASLETIANKTDFDEILSEIQKGIDSGNEKISDAEEKVASLSEVNWYYYDRYDNLSFSTFKTNAEKVNSISTVFPIFFFLVALLVSLTTMTRMVDEERLTIGTMKALGYSNGAITFKYIAYALVSGILGSAVGLAIGNFVFPSVIYRIYSMRYTLPDLILDFNGLYALIASLSIVIGTVFATYMAVRTTLAEVPASLLRPKAPKMGKRILLEHITPIWKRLSFSHKVTARNLFLYKKRFFMTVIGVAGCTALLLTGFGLRDSIGSVVDLQYKDIYKYNVMVMCQDDDYDSDFEKLLKDSGISDNVKVTMISNDVTSSNSDESVSAYNVVTDEDEELSKFIEFKDIKSKKKLEFTSDSVFITEKLAEILDVGAGDKITLTDIDGEARTYTVDAVVEHYVGSYVYIGSDVCVEQYGKIPDRNVILGICDADSESEKDALATAVLDNEKTVGVNFTSTLGESFNGIVGKLNYVVYILIISAAALAFIVLYNLININIAERQREIATIKVLGFFDKEVNSYVFRETYILTVIGSLAGLLLGVVLHRFVVKTAEMEVIMFGHSISPLSYILSVALTLGFGIVVTLIMRRKLRTIDMVESLKSAE